MMTDEAKLIELLGEGYITAIQRNLSIIETQARILLNRGVTMPRWIPVTERLPIEEYEEYKEKWQDDEDPAFLVMIKDAILPNHLYFDGKRWYDEIGSSGRYYHKVTHWMNLPEPPAKE